MSYPPEVGSKTNHDLDDAAFQRWQLTALSLASETEVLATSTEVCAQLGSRHLFTDTCAQIGEANHFRRNAPDGLPAPTVKLVSALGKTGVRE
jgi:hypothetical protein